MTLSARLNSLATRIGNEFRDSVLPFLVPAGGTEGQTILKGASGYGWGDAPTGDVTAVLGSNPYSPVINIPKLVDFTKTVKTGTGTDLSEDTANALLLKVSDTAWAASASGLYRLKPITPGAGNTFEVIMQFLPMYTASYDFQGIVLWDDNTQAARIYGVSDWNSTTNVRAFRSNMNGLAQSSDNDYNQFDRGPVWVKVTCTAGTIEFFISGNGEVWNRIGSEAFGNLTTLTHVGFGYVSRMSNLTQTSAPKRGFPVYYFKAYDTVGNALEGAESTGLSYGKSAYEVAVDNGFVGTEAAWLASLVGPTGATGAKGDKGDTGDTGQQGDPAPLMLTNYLSLNGWVEGTFDSEETILSTVAAVAYRLPSGLTGSVAKLGGAPVSAYSLSVTKNGTEIGTIDFAGASDTATFTFASDVTFAVGDVLSIVAQTAIDTSVNNLTLALRAEVTTSGSAYQIALLQGFVGTEAQWLASLVGPQGVGLVAGGTTGQVLVKNTATDYDCTWQDLTHMEIVSITGDTTVAASHVGKYLRTTSASTVTITVAADATTNLPIGSVVQIRRAAAGAVVIAAASGVTITSSGTMTLRAQNSTVSLIKVAADTWDLMGDVGTA